MCRSLHDIVLSNVVNNEIIKHEILLIKGNIVQPCDETKIVLYENGGSADSFNIEKSTGKFKILWQLKLGRNECKIVYCEKSIELNIEYTKTKCEYRVQPLYILCDGHDGHFNSDKEGPTDSAEACKKITLGLKLVQCLYAEKILEHELDTTKKTFCLNSDCIVFKSSLTVNKAKQLNQEDLWNEFAKEIINSTLGENSKIKFVAFIGCTDYEPIIDGNYSYENIKRHTRAHAALGGGGLALFGSGTLYSWPSFFHEIIPCFENKRKIDLVNFLDESNYRRTYGGCFASTIGAITHEIGHIFDLGHTAEGIMGNGFDYVNLVFTVNNLTENLPSRVVDEHKYTGAFPKDKRLTKLKQPGKFLQRHQEQKLTDSTFFTKNCALILNYHKWFNEFNDSEKPTHIFLSEYHDYVLSDNSSFRIIEIRKKTNGSVTCYYDFSTQQILKFNINEIIDFSTTNLFVITSDGTTKLFS